MVNEGMRNKEEEISFVCAVDAVNLNTDWLEGKVWESEGIHEVY